VWDQGKDPPQPREGKDRLEDCQDNQDSQEEHLTPQATTASSVTKAVEAEKIETDSSHQNKWRHSQSPHTHSRNQLKLPKSKDSTKNIAQ